MIIKLNLIDYYLVKFSRKEQVIQFCERIMAIIIPYRPRASPKIRIKIIPTKIYSCWAFALTPASPTIPMARPAA